MRIGIIGCKATKQNYACSVDEMYSKSPAYRAQSEFCKKAYDDYYIISYQVGIKHHTDIIEPYGLCLGRSSPNMASKHKIIDKLDPENVEMVNKQLAEMINKGWEIDYHTSRKYYNPLSKEIRDIINYIKQPRGVGAAIPKYIEATKMLDTVPLKECLEFISQRPNKEPEQDQWWYHPNHKPFFGTSGKIATKFKFEGINGGNAYNVGLKLTPQHKGWVIDESLLDKLYQTDSGQWRIKR